MSECLAIVPVTAWPAGPQAYVGRPNRREAARLAVAFVEGAHHALRAHFERLFGKYSDLSYAATRRAMPGYEQVRDFLMWENQCDPRIAQEVAMHVTRRDGRCS